MKEEYISFIWNKKVYSGMVSTHVKEIGLTTVFADTIIPNNPFPITHFNKVGVLDYQIQLKWRIKK